MGKTLGRIALFAAAVAVAIYAPQFAAILSSIPGAAGLGTGALLGTIGTIATAVAISTGLQLGSSLLGLGPSLPKPETTETAIKTSRPPRVSAYGRRRLYGAYDFYETSASGVATDVYAMHHGKIDGVEGHYLGDDPVTLTGDVVDAGTDGRYGGGVTSIYYTMGEATETAIAAIVALFPGIWTTDHRGDGIVTAAVTFNPVRSEDYLAIYPNQQPPYSMVARWQLCPDPAAIDPTDEDEWTWTENGVRHLMHYMLVRENVDYETAIAPTLAFWITAAAVCDQARPLKAGGTEPWYRSCVAHKHTDPHAATKSAIMATFDGWMAQRADGAYVVYAGEYYEPMVDIGPGEIIAYDWNGVGVDDSQALNDIICNYVSADHDFNTVETTPWTDEADILARGQDLSDSFDPQVPSWGQVRYLAKIRMARTNEKLRGTITVGPRGRAARGERFINIDLTEAGKTFYQGPVEVVSATRNFASGGLTIGWVRVDPSVYDYDAETDEGDPAAKGETVEPSLLEVPVITDAEALFGTTGESGGLSPEEVTGVRVVIEGTGPDRPDLTWFGRWRVSPAGAWSEDAYPDTDVTSGFEITTGYVEYGTSVDVAVRYQVGDGRYSDWTAPYTVSTSP